MAEPALDTATPGEGGAKAGPPVADRGDGLAPARWPRRLFFALLVRPLLWIVLGFNVRHRERLPTAGPAVIVANHNSHLDTLALMALFPLGVLDHLRPVAAADYFLKSRGLAWLSLRLIGILPLARQPKAGTDPLAGCVAALDRGDILILFPEGSRGEPERLQAFKAGIAHLVRRRPATPVIPVFLHGFGKALPRGEALLVPFFCDVFVGEPVAWCGDKHRFVASLERTLQSLADEANPPAWE